MGEGRSRLKRAKRKAKKAAEQWDPEQNKWQKYARCGICQVRMVVNNYQDRKARVDHMKIGGIIVCPWCRGRNGKGIVKLLKVVEAAARQEVDHELDVDPEKCKCLFHTARRVLDADFPTVRGLSANGKGSGQQKTG